MKPIRTAMKQTEHSIDADIRSKVPAITFTFWLIKICATTLGETGGDALSMTLNLGYTISTVIFFARSTRYSGPSMLRAQQAWSCEEGAGPLFCTSGGARNTKSPWASRCATLGEPQ